MTWKTDAMDHAKAEMPRESCGLLVVIKGRKCYWPCNNLSADNTNFILDPDDFCAAETAGTVVAVIHSHPDTPPHPSAADRMACQHSEMPWHIVNPVTEEWGLCKPEEFQADLIGREWVWNVFDCWSCVHQWYAQQGFTLSDYKRPPTPEEFEECPLFDQYWADAGFRELEDGEQLQEGDAILMSIAGKTNELNHVGVIVEDGRLLHHLRGRLSSVDMYGSWLQKSTGRRLRLYNWTRRSS
jgi:hypothetical protein